MLAPRVLPLLPVFVAVANAGSFTAAARELGLGKSVVSQHLRTLEQHCGLRLIERTTRRLRLTQAGEQVLDAAKEVMASVRSLEQLVEGQHAQPTGTLRVTMPLDPGLSAVVGPVAARLMKQHPSLKVDLQFDDAVHDLVGEGLDVALRLGSMVESNYVVRKLGSEAEIIVASPSLVEPCRPRRPAQAQWLQLGRSFRPSSEVGLVLSLGEGGEGSRSASTCERPRTPPWPCGACCWPAPASASSPRTWFVRTSRMGACFMSVPVGSTDASPCTRSCRRDRAHHEYVRSCPRSLELFRPWASTLSDQRYRHL